MINGYNIFWTNEVERNLMDIFNYISKNFSEKEIKKFIEKVDRRLIYTLRSTVNIFSKMFTGLF